MVTQSLAVTLIIGAVAGWLAGVIIGRSNSVITNMIVGVLGAFFGSYLFSALGITIFYGLVGSVIVATIGALVLLILLQMVKS